MGVGFAGITVWMSLTFLGQDGLHYQSTGYIKAMVTALDQEAGTEEDDAPVSGIVARLKAEMAEVERRERQVQEPKQVDETSEPDKESYIESLSITYSKDRERRGNTIAPWDGSGHQLLLWHYKKSLGRYFNNPTEIGPMVNAMGIAFHVVFYGLIVAMIVLLIGAMRMGSPVYWLMGLVPAALPVFFLIDYSAWLWWYGHRLNDMGAFTVKPFMPTVFGDGKVAQFSTHSYPYWGFGLMLLISVVLLAAIILRRKQLRRSTA